jgi:hypothetical protein
MKKFVLALGLGVLLVPGISQAHDSCVEQVKHSSHRLESAASHLAQSLRAMHVSADVQDSADQLVRTSGHLHRMADSASSCHHLQHDFENVTHAMEHLEHELQHDHHLHHNPHVRQHMQQVRVAIAAVEASFRVVPPARPVTTNVSLGSSRYRYNQTILPGTITNVMLVAQHSSSACRQGQSFGFQGNILWVNHGCNGTFAVTYVAR